MSGSSVLERHLLRWDHRSRSLGRYGRRQDRDRAADLLDTVTLTDPTLPAKLQKMALPA
jgi:hypothetical protein